MATGDLVTLSQVQTAYPGQTPEQAADAPQVISAVSAEISRRYPGCALRARHDETHDPGVSGEITLRRRPVISVARVRADMRAVLTLVYSGAGRRASASVTNSGEADGPVSSNVTLSRELAGLALSDIVLDFATYPTLADLAAHVNGLGDWTATVAPGFSDMATADLEPTQGPKNAKGGGAALWAYTTDLDDFDVEPRTGRLLLFGRRERPASYSHPGATWGADPRVNAVRVSYDAGRVTVPADVVRAVLMCVGAELENTAKPGNVNYEAGTGYAYRVQNPTYRFPPDAERILSRYKPRGFV